MGAGAVFLIFLVIVVALAAFVVLSGVGAGLWAKRTAPGKSAGGADVIDPEKSTVTRDGDRDRENSRGGV
jgi:ABC-type uncharacterized transport system YnjBCD permease subunit